MQILERSQIAGNNALKLAKEDMASRKKSTDRTIKQTVLEEVSHAVKQPVTVSGDPIKAFEHRQNNKLYCCICGISAGTFSINNGEVFCSGHKHFMYMNESDRKEEQSKC